MHHTLPQDSILAAKVPILLKNYVVNKGLNFGIRIRVKLLLVFGFKEEDLWLSVCAACDLLFMFSNFRDEDT